MKKTGYLVFIALFLAVCLLPGITLLAGYEGENHENRPLARMPKLVDRDGWNLAFPAGFDDYFEDHFGLREEMVTAFHGTTMAALGDTLNPKVIVGKHNMLFYTETLDDYLGIRLLTDEEIERIAVCLRLQQEYVLSAGAEFAFAIAPNKNTIYPEYMPEYLVPSHAPSNRERLMAALTRHGVRAIDLCGELLAAKEEGLLYHDQDTHWNERGAQIGYRAIMKAAAGDAEYEAYLGLTPVIKTDHGGDLHYFVLPAVHGTLSRPDYGIAFEYETDPGGVGRRTTIGTTSTRNDRRLLLFRDSFGDALLPYLSSNLGRVLYDAEFPYNYARVQEEAPDAVVIELVERNLKNLLAKAPSMTAIESFPSDLITLGSFAAKAQLLPRGEEIRIAGCFEGAAYHAANSRIFLKLPNGLQYEAFPILEEDVTALSESFSAPQGFSLLLPRENVNTDGILLRLETPNGAYESELMIEE